MQKKVIMFYDADSECWCVQLNDKIYGLNCGESFKLSIDGKLIPCTLELDSDWYVVMKDVRFYLRQKDKYKVVLNY